MTCRERYLRWKLTGRTYRWWRSRRRFRRVITMRELRRGDVPKRLVKILDEEWEE